MSEAVIVSAVRTPVGKFQGSLQSFSAPQLGALVVREALRRSGLGASPRAAGNPNQAAAVESQVTECIMGCVIQAGLGQNPARQAAIHAGIPPQAAP